MRERFHILSGESCNNHCIFCMEGPTSRAHGVTPDRVRALLEEHVSAGEVMFTSGEPTLNPRLPDYFRWARELGYRRIGLTTNGRRLGYGPYAEALVAAGLNHVVVSIHGSDAKTHDAQTRCPGSFRQTLAGLEALARLKHGRSVSVHTSTVVGRRNVERLGDLYWMVRAFDVDQCVFNVMQPLGRAEPLVRSLVAPYSVVVPAFARLVREAGGMKPPAFLVDVPPCTTERLPRSVRGWVECAAFTEFGAAADRRERSTRETKERENRAKRAECAGCAHDAGCLGVWKNYLDEFGWDEFVPVPAPAPGAARPDGS